MHVDSILNQAFCKLAYPEPKPLLEPNGPQNPRRIFNKAKVMNHPQNPLFNIPHGTKMIEEGTIMPLVKMNRQGINGEVSAKKIPLQRTQPNFRWSSR